MTSSRLATHDDADAIAAIHVASWRVGYAGIIPDATLAALRVDEFAQRWRLRLAGDGPRSTVVADISGQVAGFASVGPSRDTDVNPANTAELYAIYVDPERWRNGVGRALWSGARELVSGTHRFATVWVLEANRRGRAFYEQLGFVPIAEPARQVELYGQEHAEVRYRLCLEPAVGLATT